MSVTPSLIRVVPSLLVKDMAETLSFYNSLGFHTTGGSTEWAEASRDGVSIQFYTEAPQGTPETPVCSGTMYISTSNVNALAEEFRGTVDLAWGREVMPYGMNEFGIQDPNGYYIAFTEPA